MVRRLKSDVLDELPPKIRQIVVIPSNGMSKIISRESRIQESHEEKIAMLAAKAELAKTKSDVSYEAAAEKLTSARKVAFTDMAKVRHELALAKIPYVVEHCQEILDDNPGKQIVVFAHHTEVVSALAAGLSSYGVVTLTGSTSISKRQDAVDDFQRQNARVFIGNIQAAGIGITLTASDHVIFAELAWSPDAITQAEDRTHRIGQKNTVLIQHLVVEGSLDVTQIETMLEKQRVADRALDADTTRAIDAQALVTEAAMIDAATERQAYDTSEQARIARAIEYRAQYETRRQDAAIERRVSGSSFGSREELVSLAKKLTKENIQAIHQGVEYLSTVCDGARSLDGMGFSKRDVYLGKALAAKSKLTKVEAALGQRMVNFYRRQLDDSLIILAGLTPKK